MCKASLDRNCISYIIFHLLLRIFALILIGIPQMNHGLSSLETRNNNFEQQLHQSNELFMKSRISHTMDSQFHTTGDLNKDGNINSGSLGIGDSVPVHGITLNDNLLVNKDMAILKPRSDNFISNVENDQLLDEVYSKAPMFFGTENSTTVTTQIGATAHLPCVIHHIGDGVVSWIRRKDYHLLTVGLTPYSSDDRFSATHLKHSEDWTLQIKFVQLRDSGVYECQVSTHPPTSIFINLNVVEARAEIVGPQIRYLTPGSTLKFMCRIVQNTESSKFIFWYHDNRMINYDFDRGINVSTEADYHYSELTIQKATKEHSGNYTCVPSNVMPASVLVHVFKGDNTAAMYHDHRSTADKSYQSSNYLMVLMILILFSWNCDYHSLAVIQIKYYCR